MSGEELDRVRVLGLVMERRLRQRAAAQRLGLSTRQVRRLMRSLERGGAEALASRKRGRLSNRQLSEAVRCQAIELIRTRYGDCGPTLAQEKLLECHALRVSVETVRKWMVAEGLWTARRQRDARVHSPRLRRSCLGELVQIDGCDHEWFEQRAPRCVLLGVRGRRDEPVDGAALCAVRIDVRVLHVGAAVISSIMAAFGVL